MTHITFENVSIEFPIFNSASRSLTNSLLSIPQKKIRRDSKSSHINVVALRDLDFNINSGERVGIVGSNGAGKSTLLRTVAKILKPTQGSVTIEGAVGTLIDVSLGINPEATGLENIKVRGMLMGMSSKSIRLLQDEIIDFADLGNFIHFPVRTYSSGMQVRLAFAIATSIQPEILIMDEWLSVGDEDFKAKAEVRLSNVVDKSKVLVLASHSRELIERTCTRVFWLENGEIRLQGEAREVCDAYFGPHENG